MKSTSSIIHKLDEITINRIAAGEVGIILNIKNNYLLALNLIPIAQL